MGMAIYSEMDRAVIARRGRNLEYFTIAWATLEATIALVTAIKSNSLSLAGFGFDSLIEVVSGAALLWRMSHEMDHHRRHRGGTRQSPDRGSLPPGIGGLYPDRGYFQSLDAPRFGDELDRSRRHHSGTRLHAPAFAREAESGSGAQQYSHDDGRQTNRFLHVSSGDRSFRPTSPAAHDRYVV